MTNIFLQFILLVNSFVLTGKVVGVTDGDTITILSNNNIQYKVRLMNIDAPEKGQPYYKNSKSFLAKLISGKNVQCTINTKDKYGRWLGTVSVDTVNINKKMVATGNAWAYLYNKDATIFYAQTIAKKLKLGLWLLPNPTAPWLFRKQKKSTKK